MIYEYWWLSYRTCSFCNDSLYEFSSRLRFSIVLFISFEHNNWKQQIKWAAEHQRTPLANRNRQIGRRTSWKVSQRYFSKLYNHKSFGLQLTHLFEDHASRQRIINNWKETLEPNRNFKHNYRLDYYVDILHHASTS